MLRLWEAYSVAAQSFRMDGQRRACAQSMRTAAMAMAPARKPSQRRVMSSHWNSSASRTRRRASACQQQRAIAGLLQPPGCGALLLSASAGACSAPTIIEYCVSAHWQLQDDPEPCSLSAQK